MHLITFLPRLYTEDLNISSPLFSYTNLFRRYIIPEPFKHWLAQRLSCIGHEKFISAYRDLIIAATASGLHLLISCPAPGMICNSACGKRFFNCLAAFIFALSFFPQIIVTGQTTSSNPELKSSERIEWHSLIVSCFDFPNFQMFSSAYIER